MARIVNVVLNSFENDSRVLKTSLTLKALGHEVKVLALYQEGLALKEEIEGIQVERIKLASRPWPKNKLIQSIKYLEFLFRAVKSAKAAEIAHCNDLNALPVGWLLKRLYGAKVVYDAHEHETETNGLKGIEKRLKQYLERALIPTADQVITVSPSIAKDYAQLYSLPEPAVVLNCPDYDPALDQTKPQPDIFRQYFNLRPDQKIFLYQGALSTGRGLELLMDAFDSLESDAHVLVIMGYGTLESNIAARANQSQRIWFHPAVRPQVLLQYTQSADFGISFIEDRCKSYRYCLPNKLFEYLMAGLPVLVSNLPEMARVVREYNLGIVAHENSVAGVKAALSASLAQDHRVQAANAALASKTFCWQEQAKILTSLYSKLV